ncbi:MAG: hypothetical protein CL489_06365 [Acidobacteria bacterium]|nr:hypothetical protein [Acidobacteriota bacterium]|tara:strand:- start:49756 stop:50004 length:249 start_codon:yes stop_codon:yes gene_type:complete
MYETKVIGETPCYIFLNEGVREVYWHLSKINKGRFTQLVTFTEGGEFNYFYTIPGCEREVIDSIADLAEGVVKNIKFWKEQE